MPELVLFKRRWHMASDTLPVMMLLLCIVHVVWFIPYATGYWSVESTGLIYDCPQATYLRVANYSLFALFGLAAINEAAIFVLGLRGGPFQTRKRRLVPPLLYVEIALWLLLLAFTIYCTVIVYSPRVQQTCWTNNPCQWADRFPVACRDKSGAAVAKLSPECQMIVDWKEEVSCWDLWIKYGLNWMSSTTEIISGWIEDIEAQTGMPIDQLERDKPGEFDQIVGAYNDQFYDLFLNSTASNKRLCAGPFNSTRWEDTLGLTYDDSTSIRTGNMIITSFNGVNFTTPAQYNEFISKHENVFAWVNNQLLLAMQNNTEISLDVESGNYTEATEMPWTDCLSDTCQEWLQAADACTEWASILLLPNPKDRRHFFEVVVISSWSVLAATALVFYLCFNAFPSYDDVDSWEGTVKSLSALCCMGGALGGSANVGGSELEVSREIAKSLNLLFGGIDMDPTGSAGAA
ncbi:hypothetical protein COHA_010638 [Chlorella ohadii]|uniref:Uncharacterized protein n=1 Tax=Chlorella ohadii TaxID=2649997 RepID=A0AAD5DFD7_9CHLO|nr:hypothetical protein COHA_010638 [Chlorella ohadii]